MKVLFLYKYLTLGGVEAVLHARLAGLAEQGVEASAWFLHDLGGRSMFRGLEDRVQVGDVAACLRYAEEWQADLVASIDTHEILPGLQEAPRPWVLECHSGYVENLGYLSDLADVPPVLVLAPSEEQRRLVTERLRIDVPVRVVPNVVAPPFLSASRPFSPAPPRPVLAWIGRLDELKNWEGFLAISAEVAVERDVELWLVGQPVELEGIERLRKSAVALDILPRLRWLRGFPHVRMPRLLDAVRDSGGLLMSTSRRESFGLTIVEAMARGCAVLAPSQPPFDEMVPDPAGLYRPGVPGEASRRCLQLLGDDELRRRLGTLGRERALSRYAPAAALATLAAELRAAVAGDESRRPVLSPEERLRSIETP